jgi:hypothetical protein
VKRALAALVTLALAACSAPVQRPPEVHEAQAITSSFRDTLLLAAVRTKLLGDDIDSTTRVRVTVENGNVRLSGRVPTSAARARAVATARSVRGVKSVVDDLSVGRAAASMSEPAMKTPGIRNVVGRIVVK